MEAIIKTIKRMICW